MNAIESRSGKSGVSATGLRTAVTAVSHTTMLRRMLRSTLLLAALLSAGITADRLVAQEAPQGTILGRVVGVTGEPVPSALV